VGNGATIFGQVGIGEIASISTTTMELPLNFCISSVKLVHVGQSWRSEVGDVS
jgi:hypothetical protein